MRNIQRLTLQGTNFRWEYQMISDRYKVLRFDRRPEGKRADPIKLSGHLPRFNPYKRMVSDLTIWSLLPPLVADPLF